MSNPPYPPNNPNQWNQPGTPNYTQQVPPNYNQQVPPGAYQQMPPQGYQQFPPQGNYGIQEKLPNSGGILTCGIIGIILSFGLFGIILNIIALSMAGGAIRKYNENPGRYTAQSLSRVKAGRTCGIIGLSLFVVTLLIIVAANA